MGSNLYIYGSYSRKGGVIPMFLLAFIARHPVSAIISGAILADIIVGASLIASNGKILPEGVKFGFYKTDVKEG